MKSAARTGRAVACGVAVWVLSACGGGGGASGGNGGNAGGGATPAGARVALLAGGLGGSGFVDGPAATARLCSPGAMAEAADGTVFLVDCTAVRALSPSGELRTVAGSRSADGGITDGPGAQARFGWRPDGLAIDAFGALYVADGYNGLIRRIDAAGVVSTVAGQAGQMAVIDGPAASARFIYPRALLLETDGNLLIADTSTIRRLSRDGTVSTVTGKPDLSVVLDGPLADAVLGFGCAMSLDATGALFVADDEGRVRKIASGQVTTFVRPPFPSDASAPAFRAYDTCGLAINAAGEMLLSEGSAHVIDKVAADGSVSLLAGRPWEPGAADGAGEQARFNRPDKLLALRNGDTLVADQNNGTLRRIRPDGTVSTVTGAPTRRGWADGTGAAARFFSPSAVVADPDGNLFVADWANHCIRKITPDGVVTTVAGSATDEDVPEPGRTRDGAGVQARFYNPTGIAIDAARNLYVTDVNAHVVRKITPAGVVTTVAGQRGQGGYTDGDARSSLLDAPWSVAVDAQGTLYVTERYQSTVRRIAPDGSISTWVGSPGQVGDADGVGTVARLDMPVGIAIDAAGTVYVSDTATHTIRKITAGAVVTTLAGKSGLAGLADGLNREARFKRPYGLAVGADGNLYVADIGNSAVRRVTPQGGVVSTVAGGNGDQRAVVLGEQGRLNNPEALAVLPGATPRLALIDENSLLVVTPR